MRNTKYMQEGLDLKRVLLMFYSKIWLLVVAVFLGAILGVGIYLFKEQVISPEKDYVSVSKIYLDFDTEPENMGQLAYNGYTWNELMKTDPILNQTMEFLKEEVSPEMVMAATKAEILSDIRLLTITITTQSPTLTGQIMEATQKSLVHLGERDPLFRSIAIYSTTEPEKIVWDNRTKAAMATGATIAVILCFITVAFVYVLQDGVYVAKDVKSKYGLPVLGIVGENNSPIGEDFVKELKSNFQYLCGQCKTIGFLNLGSEEMAKHVECRCKDMGLPEMGVVSVDGNHMDAGMFSSLRGTEGVIVILPFGIKNGKQVERMLDNLQQQDCKILGAVIAGADVTFLKRYYLGNHRKKTGDVNPQ